MIVSLVPVGVCEKECKNENAAQMTVGIIFIGLFRFKGCKVNGKYDLQWSKDTFPQSTR
jgi:hypothetical protein